MSNRDGVTAARDGTWRGHDVACRTGRASNDPCKIWDGGSDSADQARLDQCGQVVVFRHDVARDDMSLGVDEVRPGPGWPVVATWVDEERQDKSYRLGSGEKLT